MPPSPYIRDLRAKIGTDLLMMPSAGALLFDEEGRLLLAKSATIDLWMVIGGAIDPGETPADAAVRECWEEAGVLVEPVRLIGVFGGPGFGFTYENGDRVAFIITAFEVCHVSGTPRADGVEASELRYVTAEEASALPMAPHTRDVVACAFARGADACFAPATWTPA